MNTDSNTPKNDLPSDGIAEGFNNQRLLIVPKQRLKEVENLPVLRDLRVSHVGQFSDASHHLVHRENGLDEYVLIYCLAGLGWVDIHGEYTEIKAGTLVVIPPHTTHRYGAHPKTPWSIFWFHFTGDRAADYVEALNIPQGKHTLYAPRIEELQRVFEGAYHHALDGFSEVGILGLSTAFARMIGLFRRYARSKNNLTREIEDRILRVIIALQDHMEEHWSVSRMAKLAKMSQAHFTERFKLQTGEPPMSYLIHQRIQKQERL